LDGLGDTFLLFLCAIVNVVIFFSYSYMYPGIRLWIWNFSVLALFVVAALVQIELLSRFLD
jgi:hypothetical protein